MIPTEALLSEVFAVLREMTGAGTIPLRAETLFFADLGLSSIDAIVLGERLELHFGRPLRFTEVLTDFARAGREDVALGEIAAFVQFQLDQPVEENH
ncbi:MAG TPA: phosphopantetheine-binding protein [Pirellulales bacterium]|jgi:acyl carrier protein